MVTADHDRRFQFSARYQLVEFQTGLGAFTVFEPADPRRQPLEGNALLRHLQPMEQALLMWKKLFHGVIGDANVFRIAAQRHPAEGAAAKTEERANVLRHKTGNRERI